MVCADQIHFSFDYPQIHLTINKHFIDSEQGNGQYIFFAVIHSAPHRVVWFPVRILNQHTELIALFFPSPEIV